MIHLVVALIHEARPLIDHYRLRRLKGDHPYIIYSNAQFTLIISGIGKVCSAAATAYLQALSVNKGPVGWLNFGIAGHCDFEVGQGFLAHRIIDQVTRYAYYPPLIFPFACNSSDLITVETPENDYSKQCGYEMEASGYYKIALLSSTIEWVQCYKVVSDNRNHPIRTLTKTTISRLILDRMDEIAAILSIMTTELNSYRRIDLRDDQLEAIKKRWHFSETQLSQLKGLIRRGRMLYGESLPARINAAGHREAKSFLRALKHQLDAGFTVKLKRQTN